MAVFVVLQQSIVNSRRGVYFVLCGIGFAYCGGFGLGARPVVTMNSDVPLNEVHMFFSEAKRLTAPYFGSVAPAEFIDLSRF